MNPYYLIKLFKYKVNILLPLFVFSLNTKFNIKGVE